MFGIRRGREEEKCVGEARPPKVKMVRWHLVVHTHTHTHTHTTQCTYVHISTNNLISISDTKNVVSK